MKGKNGLILASMIIEEMKPYCKKIEVVGDIRRQCNEVAVIELLAVSRTIEMTNIFGALVAPYELINDWVQESGLYFHVNEPESKHFDWRKERVWLHLTSE